MSLTPPLLLHMQRMTPSAAEKLSGRDKRKHWKETFKTWTGNQAITLKKFFDMHGE